MAEEKAKKSPGLSGFGAAYKAARAKYKESGGTDPYDKKHNFDYKGKDGTTRPFHVAMAGVDDKPSAKGAKVVPKSQADNPVPPASGKKPMSEKEYKAKTAEESKNDNYGKFSRAPLRFDVDAGLTAATIAAAAIPVAGPVIKGGVAAFRAARVANAALKARKLAAASRAGASGAGASGARASSGSRRTPGARYGSPSPASPSPSPSPSSGSRRTPGARYGSPPPAAGPSPSSPSSPAAASSGNTNRRIYQTPPSSPSSPPPAAGPSPAATAARATRAANNADRAASAAAGKTERAARQAWNAANPDALKAHRAFKNSGKPVPPGTPTYKNTDGNDIDPYMYKKGGKVKAKALPFWMNKFKNKGAKSEDKDKAPMKYAKGGMVSRGNGCAQRGFK